MRVRVFVKTTLLSAVVVLAFGGTPAGHLAARRLGVRLVPQRGTLLCWAACTEMLSQYVHDRIDSSAPVLTQCSQARLNFLALCQFNSARRAQASFVRCSDTGAISDTFNLRGEPFSFPDTGYAIGSVQGPLSWDALLSQFDSLKPIIFKLGSVAGSGSSATGYHVLVAEGALSTRFPDYEHWVSVMDPWPKGTGRHHIISYDEFARPSRVFVRATTSRQYIAHDKDYVGLQYHANR